MHGVIKEAVRKLRQEGMTYSEIVKILNVSIPRSTLSYWCKGLEISESAQEKFKQSVNRLLIRAREKAQSVKKEQRQAKVKLITEENADLLELLKNGRVAKLSLSILYLAEGSKNRAGTLTFCNSDAGIIKLFLTLLRCRYSTEAHRFRCTVQCRADQDNSALQLYWSGITQIPLDQFYKTLVDPRTVGKPTLKSNYMGVCRIDYFSADVYHELTIIPKIITE